MPGIEFQGKHIVYAHHLSVPYRTLDIVRKKSLLPRGAVAEEGNMIVHGDNLHALKALLPRYAGRVHCIYIDPPYNTGNEGWCYNDNVNSELMRRWLKENGAVDGEDEERHDKWLCMMWPRLQLLRELLAEDGAIFISIDDNEQHRLRMVMDEIFGELNFLAEIAWQGMDTIKNDARYFSTNRESIIVFAKNLENVKITGIKKTEKQRKVYKNHDNDPRGDYLLTPLHAKSGSEENVYEFKFPNGQIWKAPQGTYPRYSIKRLKELVTDGRILLDPAGKKTPQKKTYWSETGDRMRPTTFWPYEIYGSTRQANAEMRSIFGRGKFDNTKPVKLVKICLDLIANRDSIILDSFAGSGTTAQAVLELNKEDGGNRQFILVECEDYADGITAERVRRVIKGVPNAKNETLKAGLGGSFAFCKLGRELDTEKIITGKDLPDYDALALHAAYTATGAALGTIKSGADHFFGETAEYRMHMIYRPDRDFLCSNESALTRELAQRIGKAAQKKGKTALVFAPWKFISQKELTQHKVTFCQLPYAIHRLFGNSFGD